MGQLYFEDVNVGDEVTPIQKNASSQQLVKYAGASGDYYQIHYDDGFARNNGLDGIIIHGALKNAFLGQLVTDWMGPHGQLKKLSVSYRAMDFPNEDLVCSGTVTGKRVEGGAGIVECEIALHNAAGKATTPGKAIVSLPMRGI